MALQNRFAELILGAAAQHGLDPVLFASLIMHESAGDPWAFEFEQDFYNTYISWKPTADLPGFFPAFPPTKISEKMLRSVSYGLTQIMGENAREHGFKGRYLAELFDPALNLEFGGLFLAQCIHKSGSEKAGLLRYNGGADETYPDAVFKIRDAGTYRGLIE